MPLMRKSLSARIASRWIVPRQDSRITFIGKNCFSVLCIHLCFRRSWWSHFGSTNRWFSSWPGLIGGFDVVLADKGFLIKEHVSADIETKGQIDLHNAKGESYSKCHISGHDSGGSGGSDAEQIWLFGATSFFPSLNMHKGSCVIMTFQFNELLFILITWHHLPRGAQ